MLWANFEITSEEAVSGVSLGAGQLLPPPKLLAKFRYGQTTGRVSCDPPIVAFSPVVVTLCVLCFVKFWGGHLPQLLVQLGQIAPPPESPKSDFLGQNPRVPPWNFGLFFYPYFGKILIFF